MEEKIKELQEYISVLEAISEKDKELISQLRKTINSLMAYKIKANLKIKRLENELKEIKENDTNK